MKINTSRFGELEVDDQAIVTVPGGLIGFTEQQRYVILQHKPGSPFYWFQAVDHPDLAFVIVNPLTFKPDYVFDLPKALLGDLHVESPEDVAIYVIVTIPHGRPQEMTANLLGPLVINTRAKLARQIILDEARYSHRHPVMPSTPEETEDQEDQEA